MFITPIQRPSTPASVSGLFPAQTANFVFAGPSSGGASAPSFRPLVDDDIPAALTLVGGSADNIPIGQVTPAAGKFTTLIVNGLTELGGQLQVTTSGSIQGIFRTTDVGGTTGVRLYDSTNSALQSVQFNLYAGNRGAIEVIPSLPLVFLTANTERARITAAGYLKVSASGVYLGVGTYTEMIQPLTTASQPVIVEIHAGTTGDNIFNEFLSDSVTSPSLRGTISYNRGGGVIAYNTTSDSRLKYLDGIYLDAADVLRSLVIYKGRMKDAPLYRPMFIAHQIQPHVPYAITGDRDGETYQQVDHQIMVPLLAAGWKDVDSRITRLEKHLGLVSSTIH